jgi:hypothetical protein
MHHGGLKKRWKYQVVTRMKEAHKEGKWRFPESASYLKLFPCFAAMLNKLWKLTWWAYIGASLADPRFSVQYIGRYTKRAVIAEYRITFWDGKLIRFSFKDYANGGNTSYKTLKVETFIARLIRHIPDKHFPMIRYAGLFSSRWKSRYLDQARSALGQCQPAITDAEQQPAWADRQMAYSGSCPISCPDCNEPMTYRGMVFGSWGEIQELFMRAGYQRPIPSALLKPG